MSIIITYTYNGKLCRFHRSILSKVLSTDYILSLDVSIAVTNSFPPITDCFTSKKSHAKENCVTFLSCGMTIIAREELICFQKGR